jgi:hypothetical protein
LDYFPTSGIRRVRFVKVDSGFYDRLLLSILPQRYCLLIIALGWRTGFAQGLERRKGSVRRIGGGSHSQD